MAMWKYDAFSNDDALDFVGVLGLLSDHKKVSVFVDALTAVVDSNDRLELIDVCGAVAAAALVAIQLSPNLMPEDHTIEELLLKLPDMTSHKSLAAHALQRSLTPDRNEWYDLLKVNTSALAEMKHTLQAYLDALTT